MPPPDYIELIDAHGGGTLDRDLTVFEPGAVPAAYDLLTEGLLRAEDAEEFWAEGDPDFPRPPRLSAPGTRLICWASTPAAEFLYWVVPSAVPSASWTIALQQGEDHLWEFFDLGTVAFLHSLLTGGIESSILKDWYARQDSHSYTHF
ncbi:hypothetical protein [Spirillospora sp. NPDC029432]|uniref:hypothetical protein n=1 Tax=Spirillospora sp. NPDC029432 TaxID=3154599 RepID=UPI003452A144